MNPAIFSMIKFELSHLTQIRLFRFAFILTAEKFLENDAAEYCSGIAQIKSQIIPKCDTNNQSTI